MQNKFSTYLTGSQKNHGTQHAPTKMIETWKNKTKLVSLGRRNLYGFI